MAGRHATNAILPSLVSTRSSPNSSLPTTNGCARWLPRQERRPGHRWHGSIPDDFGIHSIGGTAQFIAALVCACRSPASAFHESSDVAEALDRAAGYLLEAQHDDGTIDLISTNFHSPPDTAFVLEPVTAAATILRRTPWAPLRAFVRSARRLHRQGRRGADHRGRAHAESPLGGRGGAGARERAASRSALRGEDRPVAGRDDRHRPRRPVHREELVGLLARRRSRAADHRQTRSIVRRCASPSGRTSR